MRFVFIDRSYGRGAGVGRLLGPGLDRGVGLGRGVAVGVDVGVAVAVAVAVGVGVGLSVAAQYLPPVFKYPPLPIPPHTIISLPVHTAVCCSRPAGAPVVLVAAQLSVLRLYLPPVLKEVLSSFHPPQMII